MEYFKAAKTERQPSAMTLKNMISGSFNIEELRQSIKVQQRQIFIMCQSNRDYQALKDKYRQNLIKNQPKTILNLIYVAKLILTGYSHPILISSLSPSDQNKIKYLQAQDIQAGNSLNVDVPNPYTHLLVLRLIKQTLTLNLNYALLLLIETQLKDLFFKISGYESNSKDQERGRSLYLQNQKYKNKQTFFQMENTNERAERETLGYSVHLFALEIQKNVAQLMTLLPYHLTQKLTKLSENQKDNYTDRPITPRNTLTMSNISQIQKLKLKNFQTLIRQKCRPAELQSTMNKNYLKLIQMNVKFPINTHYLKQKESEKLKKDYDFCLKSKPHHIHNFYIFLIGIILRSQIEWNIIIYKEVCLRTKKQIKSSVKNWRNSYLLIINKILESNDRFSIYYVAESLYKLIKSIRGQTKFIKEQPKLHQTVSDQQYKIIVFLSICEIIDSLFICFKIYEQKQSGKMGKFSIQRVNCQVMKAIDELFAQQIINSYLFLYDCSSNKPKIDFLPFYQYSRFQIYYLIQKWSLISQILIDQIKQKKQFLKEQDDSFSQMKMNLNHLSKLAAKIQYFFTTNNSRTDYIEDQYIFKIDNKIQKIDQIKNCFAHKFSTISQNPVSFSVVCLTKITSQIALINQFDIVQYVQHQTKTPYHESIPLEDKLAQNLDLHFNQHHLCNQDQTNSVKKFKTFGQTKTTQIAFNFVNLDKMGPQQQIQTIKTIKTINHIEQTQEEIPIQNKAKIPQPSFKINARSSDLSKISPRNKSSDYLKNSPKVQKGLSLNKKQSFLQNLKISNIQLGQKQSNDVNTLRSVRRKKSRNKSSLKKSSYINSQTNSFEQMSCPNYMLPLESNIELSQASEYRKYSSVKQFQSQTKIRELRDQIKYQRKRRQQLQQAIKNKDSEIKLLKQKSNIRRVTGISNIQNLPKIQLSQNQTQKTSFSQKMKQLKVKQTDSYEMYNNNVETPDKKSKVSKFYDSSNGFKKKYQNIQSPFDTIKQIQYKNDLKFTFSTKIKKEILKKKVLLLKNKMMEVGMISQISKKITNSQKQLKRQYQKLKSNIYITPLMDLDSIRVQIKSPSWISSDITSNKLKQNATVDCQYIVNVQSVLVKQHFSVDQLNILPEFIITTVEKQKLYSQKQKARPEPNQKIHSQINQKIGKTFLPIFLTKFISQQELTQNQKSLILQQQVQQNFSWYKLNDKLAQSLNNLQKYFKHVHISQMKAGIKLKYQNRTEIIQFLQKKGKQSSIYFRFIQKNLQDQLFSSLMRSAIISILCQH